MYSLLKVKLLHNECLNRTIQQVLAIKKIDNTNVCKVYACVSISLPKRKENKRKAATVTADRVLFWVDSIYNLFVNPELRNTTYPIKYVCRNMTKFNS